MQQDSPFVNLGHYYRFRASDFFPFGVSNRVVGEWLTKFVAFFLIALWTAAFVEAHFCLPQMSAGPVASESCPMHQPTTPQPAPASHRCCVAGSTTAFLPSVYYAAALTPKVSPLLLIEPTPHLWFDARRAHAPLWAGIPSDRLPLRV